MITDPNTIVPCSYCSKPVRIADAYMTVRVPHDPAQGFWLYETQTCLEQHAIARQMQPIFRNLPPGGPETKE
jgi:hypothetical protein